MKDRDKDTLAAIARNLRRIREERNLSQNALATMIDDYNATIVRIEAGTNMPGAGLLYRIAKALRVPVQDLYAGVEESTPPRVRKAPDLARTS